MTDVRMQAELSEDFYYFGQDLASGMGPRGKGENHNLPCNLSIQNVEQLLKGAGLIVACSLELF